MDDILEGWRGRGVLAELLSRHENEVFDDLVSNYNRGHRSAATARPALEDLIRDSIDEEARVRARSVKRIRITEMVPAGSVFVVPFVDLEDEWRFGQPSRTIHSGPNEILVNPDEWEALVEHYRKTMEKAQREHPTYARLEEPPTPPDTGYKYVGIPVVDDTIEMRMRLRGEE